MHQVLPKASEEPEDVEGIEVEIGDGSIFPFYLVNFNGSRSSLLSLFYFVRSLYFYLVVFCSYIFNSTVVQIFVYPFDFINWKVKQLLKQLE